jgi:vancomycin resistance protein YoaR
MHEGMRRSLLAGAVVGAFCAAGAIAGRWVSLQCWANDEICAGIRIAGQPLPVSADAGDAVRQQAAALIARTVDLSVAGRPDLGRTVTLGDLGVTVDVDRSVARVRQIGHRGTIIDRWVEARIAQKGRVDVPLALRLDPDRSLWAIGPVKDDADEAPVPARLDLINRTVVAHRPGLYVGVDDAMEAILSAAASGADRITIARTEVDPRVSTEYLEKIDIHEQVAKFETWFSRGGDQATRAQNIDTGAARLDGAVLLPNDVFSFNDTVGPRTVENGFSKGWEIFKGEMVEGIGGGTCQVASTLHAAAFLAGLDVIERLPHSRPSAYITMGLDATVVYPVVDLKIRNPFTFPIVIHSFTEGGKLTFELLGKERPAKVVFARHVLAWRPYTRKVEQMPGLAADKIIRKQHGIRGFKILRTRTITLADGTVRREHNVDVYPPTTETYLVAPGTDPDVVLAPLPEGEPAWSAGVPPPKPTEPAAAPLACDAGNCASDQPKIVSAPGVHAPRADQLNARGSVVIAR